MKFCDHHWAMLRAAIEARGLTEFIRTPDQHAGTMTKIVECLNEGGAAEDASAVERDAPYDPLWSALWMIQNHALQLGGLYLLTVDEQGNHRCPVCEAVKNLSTRPLEEGGPPVGVDRVESDWINGPADAAHQECVRRGLIKES